MRTAKREPRYITPASIDIGDTVKVTTEVGDVTVTRTGKVAKREYDGGMRIFTTESGMELFRWHPEHRTMKVTLLDKAITDNHTMLDIFV